MDKLKSREVRRGQRKEGRVRGKGVWCGGGCGLGKGARIWCRDRIVRIIILIHVRSEREREKYFRFYDYLPAKRLTFGAVIGDFANFFPLRKYIIVRYAECYMKSYLGKPTGKRDVRAAIVVRA